MKKKLLLDTVLKLRTDVERELPKLYDSIIKYNFTEVKVDSMMDQIEKLELQLLHFKEVIQEANLSKFEGKTNNYHIYHLSNLTAKSMFYKTLITALKRSPKKAELAQIGLPTATTVYQKLKEEITKFQNKLSAFNSKKKVTVYLDEEIAIFKTKLGTL
jgi:tRNA/tmRNA/rRNA uracil-C5-methylase (TrmA/RlmC/RlmD family)